MAHKLLGVAKNNTANKQNSRKQTNKNLQNTANTGATKVVEIAPICKSDTGRQFYLEISMTKVSSSPPFLTKQKPCSSEILKSGFKCGMLDQGSHFQQCPCQGVYWKQSFVWHLLKKNSNNNNRTKLSPPQVDRQGSPAATGLVGGILYQDQQVASQQLRPAGQPAWTRPGSLAVSTGYDKERGCLDRKQSADKRKALLSV